MDHRCARHSQGGQFWHAVVGRATQHEQSWQCGRRRAPGKRQHGRKGRSQQDETLSRRSQGMVARQASASGRGPHRLGQHFRAAATRPAGWRVHVLIAWPVRTAVADTLGECNPDVSNDCADYCASAASAPADGFTTSSGSGARCPHEYFGRFRRIATQMPGDVRAGYLEELEGQGPRRRFDACHDSFQRLWRHSGASMSRRMQPSDKARLHTS